MTTHTSSIQETYQQYILGNYGEAPLTLVRGEGSYVWDDAGRRYLDFTTGIAVNALGHSHPHWVKRVQAQVEKLVHVSNLYRVEEQAQLAEKLSQYTGAEGKFFFCNSGAEANEGLLKLARLHGQQRAGEEGKVYHVITANMAFHGRTFGGMAATPQAKIQNGFAPMLPGFSHAELNDIDSFAANITEQTAAIMIETVQGEGGINPCTCEFLQGIRKLCDEHNLLMLIDEVQCGGGRTGKYFAFQNFDVKPDAIGMAKGIAAGFPMGAIWISDAYAPLFKPGSHGTTFGGTPLACTASLATLEAIEQEGLLEKVTEQAAPWHAALRALASKYPQHIAEVRALGYMVGIGLTQPPLKLIGMLREKGLIAPPAGNNTLRFLPPLTASAEELAQSVQLLDEALSELTLNENT